MTSYKDLRLFGQFFEIVAGTNEEFLIGFHINYKEDGTFALKSTFANHSHCSGIRKLTICGTSLISGGVDEMLHVFNLKRRGKVGVIGEHEGSITDIQQHKHRFIFSAAEDGKICIFKVGVWECEKSLVGHKGTINSIAIHPTGKLALSVGVDKTLHTWDLIKGRRAYVTNLKEVGTIVRWSPTGDSYIVVMESRLDLYLVESATNVHSADFYVRINEVIFITETIVAVALENGKVCLHNTSEGITVQQWEAHTSRVRAMAAMPTVSPDHDALYLVTGSSDGWVKVWGVTKDNLKIPAECVTAKNTQCRVTCLAVYSDVDYRQAAMARHSQEAGGKVRKEKKTRGPYKKKIKYEPESEEEELDEASMEQEEVGEEEENGEDYGDGGTEEEEEEEVEHKPIIIGNKRVRIEVTAEEKKAAEEMLEVYSGDDALELLGIGSIKTEPDDTVKRSKRKNKGRPPKRIDEDSD